MTVDTELEAWQRDWRAQAEPLPQLKRQIKRQNLRMVAAVTVISVCLALSAAAAIWRQSSFMAGLATGIWVACLSVGAYTWRVRRGAWKPAAQTTLGYAELSYKRAVAKLKTLRFSFWFLVGAIVLYAFVAAWDWRSFRVSRGIILAAIVAEAFALKRYGRRKQQEVEETKRLLDDLKR